MSELQTDDQIRDLLRRTTSIVVLGAHPSKSKPAHYVPAYMKQAGYTIVSVNPRYAGRQLFGGAVIGRLSAVGRTPLARIGGESLGQHESRRANTSVDMINVFRRSADLGGHLQELLDLEPRSVWLQLGIRNDVIVERLSDIGIDVVQDRCLLVEHRRLIGGYKV